MAKTSRTTRRKSSLPKLLEKYYADLADLARQNVFVEMGTRTAFFALLHAAGREHGWTLIADKLDVEIEKKRKAGHHQPHSPIRASSGVYSCIRASALMRRKCGRFNPQPEARANRRQTAALPCASGYGLNGGGSTGTD